MNTKDQITRKYIASPSCKDLSCNGRNPAETTLNERNVHQILRHFSHVNATNQVISAVWRVLIISS